VTDLVLRFPDIQVIDTKTCEPVPETYIEIWACNSTGVYSGVTSQGNGNPADTTNLNSTAFRGVQATGDLGAVSFDTAVPGHCENASLSDRAQIV
jgi:protocatechuate 3,4-dioxygenase beta subunit